MKILKNNYIKFLIISLILFLAIFPISNQINFMQNDDYAYYKMLAFFMDRKLFLIQNTSASFITQGIMSLPFAHIFGITKMPVFTLLISVINFFLVCFITYKYFFKNKFWDSLIVGLIFFLNPLHFYSIFGYMTENYFSLFLLLIILFFKRYEASNNILNFSILNLTIFAGFLLRQFSMLAAFALSIYFFYQKKYKLAFLQLIIFLGILGFYQFIFPQTPDMKDETGRNLMIYFQDPSTVYKTVVALLLYFAAFCFPIILSLVKSSNEFKNKLFILITSISFVGIFIIYQPGYRISDSLFYLRNTISQNGFIFTSRLGVVEPINFGIPYFEVWDLIAKISLGLMLGLFFFKYKKLISFYSIFIVVYLGLIVSFTSVYDRYALPIIIFGIFMILSLLENGLTKISKYFAVFYFILVFAYNYQATMRFFLANKYLWNRATELSNEYRISKNRIMPGYPWFLIYEKRGDLVFVFSFTKDNPQINLNKYSLYEVGNIDFPFSMYNSNEVYVYKRN